MPDPILYESHMHTPLCMHAEGEPEEYAAVAAERNLKGIIVTCHNPMPNGYSKSVRMREDQFQEYLDLIERARGAYAGRVDVRAGMECDYVPGFESWVEKQIGSARFNFILGSIHPHVSEYRARFRTGSAEDYQRLYFVHLAQAAETGFFDSLAHPDLIKNETAESWALDRILPDIQRCLDRIARTGVAMELNTSGLNKRIREMNPSPTLLREMAQRNIPVTLGADAHIPARVADRYEEAIDLLAAAGHTHLSLFLGRKRSEIPLAEARQSLRKREVGSAVMT